MPEELFDVVDKNNDTVIGREARTVVHQQGLWHRGVHVFLFTRDGRLLVQQRSRDKDRSPLALDCSVSEHVQAGERYDQAAERGVFEELGVSGMEIQPLVKFKMQYGPNDQEISRVYYGFIEPASVHFDPAEIEQVAYYTIAELLEMLPEPEAKFCFWFKQLLFWYTGRASEMEIMQVDSDERPFL